MSTLIQVRGNGLQVRGINKEEILRFTRYDIEVEPRYGLQFKLLKAGKISHAPYQNHLSMPELWIFQPKVAWQMP